MFLCKLSEDNKRLFLELSTHAALSNNNLTKDKEEIIKLHSEELGIYDYKIEKSIDTDTLLEKIKSNSSKEEIEITVFEIAALMMSDNKYDSLEREFINNIQDKLDISSEKLNSMLYLINQLMGDYRSCISEVV